MTIDLTGKVALVTGSSRGIGYSIASRLLSAGATVIINARAESPEFLAAKASLQERWPGQIEGIAADVSDQASATKLVRAAFDSKKRLDVLVNNAGILRDNLIGMISADDIQQILNTNLLSVINTIQAAARLMARNKSGSIVNISSIIGLRGNRGQLVYAASKAGVIGATLSAAKELAGSGVRVNAIAPGFIQTAMVEHLSPEVYEQRVRSIAMQRVGSPDDIANAVLFFASPLSSYVTGQVLGVDGGMVI